eukprot:scaffold43832_cov22-Tisochrysis_lutea.AAC.1
MTPCKQVWGHVVAFAVDHSVGSAGGLPAFGVCGGYCMLVRACVSREMMGAVIALLCDLRPGSLRWPQAAGT